MIAKKDKNELRKKRHYRARRNLSGTPERPRLCVYRSLNNIYAQVIDDVNGVTLVSASTMEKEIMEQAKGKKGVEAAAIVGEAVGKRAKAKKIKAVVFDRGGYVYTGRVASLAEGARKAGLEF
jgi:large subunit ribosomal protein L18